MAALRRRGVDPRVAQCLETGQPLRLKLRSVSVVVAPTQGRAAIDPRKAERGWVGTRQVASDLRRTGRRRFGDADGEVMPLAPAPRTEGSHLPIPHGAVPRPGFNALRQGRMTRIPGHWRCPRQASACRDLTIVQECHDALGRDSRPR